MTPADLVDAPPPIPPDHGLAGAEGLFAQPGLDALAAFLARRHWSLGDARAVQALYRPGRSCVVRYRAWVRTAQGSPRILSLCVEAARDDTPPPAPPGALPTLPGLPDPVDIVHPYLVWCFPYDPSLDALPDAAWGPAVREVVPASARPVSVTAEPLRYRPRRRAAFRYVVRRPGVRRVMYGKVLRPSRMRKAVRAAGSLSHTPRLRLALPYPPAGDGPLLFEPADGTPLRDLLLQGGSLPAPGRLARLLEDVAGAGDAGGVSEEYASSLAEQARWVGRLVSVLVAECSSEVERVVEAAVRGAEAEPPRLGFVHGDLYDAQVFVAPDFKLGLIDLDDMGPGDPALDAANLCAHLVALGLSVPQAAARCVAYRQVVREAFLSHLGLAPSAFAWREALSMLALATGPFRVLDPNWPREVSRRVNLAVRLLEQD